jgi:hypothetical protein
MVLVDDPARRLAIGDCDERQGCDLGGSEDAVSRELSEGDRSGSDMIKQPGAWFEILVDGKPRYYRDTKIAASAAATFLKSQLPHSEVAVKDLQSGTLTMAVNRAP